MMKRDYKTGRDRGQASFLPPRLEDYVAADNPVRAIDGYVDTLDLTALGFRDAGSDGGRGQPPYAPGDLLKLYLYGYLHQVRSSRRLEREAGRNVEVMWLLRGLCPGYRTIADFRRTNAAGLIAANRAFVLLARRLDLFGGELIAIDGAFFDGNASKGSIQTRKRLDEQMAVLDRSIAQYGAALEHNDRAEDGVASASVSGSGACDMGSSNGDFAARLALLRERRAGAEADLKTLEASGQTQLSRTDPDARLLVKHGQIVAGYNVQIAVDGKHKLIVAGAVINDGNDLAQLYPMARAAQTALEAETIAVAADAGYYNAEALKACEDEAITAYVPPSDRSAQRMQAQDRFSLSDFSYDAEADLYRCPTGKALRPIAAKRVQGATKTLIRYDSSRKICRACPLRERCLSPKGNRRQIERWEHEAVVERHKARMQQNGAAMMRCRKAWAEHPFGTLKCRAGYRHFLVRTLPKVRGEWSLMMLCYNFSRVLRILGMTQWLAVIAQLIAAIIQTQRPAQSYPAYS